MRQDHWDKYVDAMIEGQFFNAHEILEIPWRQHRDKRLQLAIWLAAAFVHWSHQRHPGATRLFSRILADPDAQSMPARDLIAGWHQAAKKRGPLSSPPRGALEAIAAWGRTV